MKNNTISIGTIDLHIHSTASDGTYTPSQIAKEAKKAGLAAFALTDHDTTDGIEDASKAAEKEGIEFIPGVELSTEYNGESIHMVGLYIDANNKPLQGHMAEFRNGRNNRNAGIIEKLQQEGIDITMEGLKECYPNAVIARPHIARYMMEHGYVYNIKEAFEKYIGHGKKCYVSRPKVSPETAIRYILDAGGIPILAHPVTYHMEEDQLLYMIRKLKSFGLAGIEAIYSENTPADEWYFIKIAEQEGLLASGGSDFHGTNKPKIKLGAGYGLLTVPYQYLEYIKETR